MSTISSPTSLHILLQGMHSHDLEQIVQGSSLIRSQLEAEASEKVKAIHTSACNISDEVKFVVRILAHQPDLAAVRGGRDDNLPLQIAAQIGNLYLCRMIWKAYPDAVKLPNKKGKLPLHSAARCGHLDVVNFLIQVFPKGAAFQSKKRKLPLHFSVSDGHYQVTKRLLQAHPEGVRAPSAKGKLPLHLAARWGHVDVVKLLLDIYPDGAKFLDWEGSLPLHDASLENQEEVAKMLIAAYPEGLKACNIRGELPLFASIRSNNPKLAFEMLRIFPEGGKLILQGLNETDRVATLHWHGLELCLRAATGMLSSINPRSFGIVSSFEREHLGLAGAPEALREIPHYAYMRDIEPAASQFCTRVMLVEVPNVSADLIEVGNPQDTRPEQSQIGVDTHLPRPAKRIRGESDSVSCLKHTSLVLEDLNQGSDHNVSSRSQKTLKKTELPVSRSVTVFLPMHAAIQIKASYPVLRRVLAQCPDQVFVQDCFGRLPLHLIASQCYGANVLFLEDLLRAYPYACISRDLHNRLPFHTALLHQADSRGIAALMNAHPASAFDFCRTCDEFFHLKPLFLALSSGCSLNVIYSILRGDPSVVLTSREEGL